MAITLYRAANDVMGETHAKEVFGAIADAKATLKAEEESMGEVSSLMGKMKAAIEDRSIQDLEDVMKDIYANEYVTQEHIDRIVDPLIEKDPEGVQSLLNAGLAVPNPAKQSFSPVPPKGSPDEVFFRPYKIGWQIDRRQMYLGSRWSGMGYGPNLRQGKTFYCHKQGHWSKRHGQQTGKTLPNCADWEHRSQYLSAGILDCALMATGAMQSRPDKALPEDLTGPEKDIMIR